MIDGDQDYFDAILNELAQTMRCRTGQPGRPFCDLVRQRIQHGAELYGPRAFLAAGRDNLQEARDEYADGVSYPLFELRKLALDGADALKGYGAEAARLLFDAMVDSAQADLKVRQARQILRAKTARRLDDPEAPPVSTGPFA